MAFDPFELGKTDLSTTAAKQAAARRKLDALVGNKTRQLLFTYNELMKQVYENLLGLTTQEVAATLSPEDSVQIRRLAILFKSLINTVSPGKVGDFIPEATITMPANLFPEV